MARTDRSRQARILMPWCAGLAGLLAAGLLPWPSRAEPIRGQGRRLARILDATHVERLWQPRSPVDWRTGEPDSSSANLTGHCSAFAAAVCARLDIYILRPPEHSESLLANAQCDWLDGEGSRNGWRPVPEGVAAQSLANRGHLVVACYRNPDRDDAGHIAIVRPSAKNRRRILSEGPDIIQAGARNYYRTSLKSGFKLHPRAWREQKVRYYSHSISWRGTS